MGALGCADNEIFAEPLKGLENAKALTSSSRKGGLCADLAVVHADIKLDLGTKQAQEHL